MKCIEAIIKPSMLEDVKQRVRQVGVETMTLSEVANCGGTSGRKMIYRTAYTVDSVSRVRIQTIVDEDMVEPVVDAIMASASAGEDNGTISVYPVSETMRIQTGARPSKAIGDLRHGQARVA